MFIAVDGISDSLPEDVQRFARNFTARSGSVDRGQQESEETASDIDRLDAKMLDRWDVQAHQYTTQAAVETSILGRLLGGKLKASSCGIVQEAKRYCISTTDSGRRIEHGTAVRLSVVVLETELDVSLTLPNIAAKSQISNVTARISLSVDGYNGPLGKLLPAPDNLNVENLGMYTAAFKAIQALVFGEDGLEYLAPTLLGFMDDDVDEQAQNVD